MGLIDYWHFCRSCIFILGQVFITLIYLITALLGFAILPKDTRHKFFISWNAMTVIWCRLSCGIRYEIEGEHLIPKGERIIIVANHQSQWETYFLQRFSKPICTVMKKELLEIPIFGWLMKLTDPISLDRSNPKQSIKKLLDVGKRKILAGYSLLIFPEGTRRNPDEQSKPYARGAASIAIATNRPIVPVAHNAATLWPNKAFIKKPGVIKIKVGPPIYPTETSSSKSITQEAQTWIEEQLEAMD